MTGYSSVFKRVEKKYRTSAAMRSSIEAVASAYMNVDAFKRTCITSLYLDTPNRDMIARSIEKPLYKEKLRLRVYGEAESEALVRAFCTSPLDRHTEVPPLSDEEVVRRATLACAGSQLDPLSIKVFFGIKKKFKGVVYKRRLALSLPAALAFVSGLSYEQACTRWPLAGTLAADALSAQKRQIGRELEATMNRWMPLVPSMAISCYREAWAPRLDAPAEAGAASSLRITFDDTLRYLDCAEANPTWIPILDADETIMEVKCAGAYTSWLTEMLSSLKVYPSSFTKYGTAYQMSFANRNKALPGNGEFASASHPALAASVPQHRPSYVIPSSPFMGRKEQYA